MIEKFTHVKWKNFGRNCITSQSLAELLNIFQQHAMNQAWPYIFHKDTSPIIIMDDIGIYILKLIVTFSQANQNFVNAHWRNTQSLYGATSGTFIFK